MKNCGAMKMKYWGAITLSGALLLVVLNLDPCMAKSGTDVDLSSALNGTVTGVDAALCYGQMVVDVAEDGKPKLVVSYDLPDDWDVQASVKDNVLTVQPSMCNDDHLESHKGYVYATLSLPAEDKLNYLNAGVLSNLFLSTPIIDDKLNAATGGGMIVFQVPKSITELNVTMGSGEVHISHESGTSDGTLSRVQLDGTGSFIAYIDFNSVVEDGTITSSGSGLMLVNAKSFDNLNTSSRDSGKLMMQTSDTSKSLKAVAATAGKSNMCGAVFSEVEVAVSEAGTLEVGVTSDAKISGKSDSGGSATFIGDASILGVESNGGSVTKGSECQAMSPFPELPSPKSLDDVKKRSKSGGSMRSVSYVVSALFAMATAFFLD